MRREPRGQWGDSGGQWGDYIRRGRDPAIQEIIRRAGRGINPLAYSETNRFLAMSGSTQNPYVPVVLAAFFLSSGIFVLYKTWVDAPFWGWVTLGVFAAISGYITFINVRRMPAWHRARRDVREYLKTNPGEFPLELRWYR